MFRSLITNLGMNEYTPESDTNMFESTLMRSKIRWFEEYKYYLHQMQAKCPASNDTAVQICYGPISIPCSPEGNHGFSSSPSSLSGLQSHSFRHNIMVTEEINDGWYWDIEGQVTGPNHTPSSDEDLNRG